MKPEATSSLSGEVRHAICHKLYTDWILGSEFYPTKYCYLWPFSFQEWCNSQENNGVYSDSALNSFNLRNKPPFLHLFSSNAPTQNTKKHHNKATGSEFTTNSVCSWKNFTPLKRNFTRIISVHPWQIPCLGEVTQLAEFPWRFLPSMLSELAHYRHLVFSARVITFVTITQLGFMLHAFMHFKSIFLGACVIKWVAL